MQSTINKEIGGKVFGELTLSVLSAKSIEDLHSEVIIQEPNLILELKNGSLVNLDVHEMFVENKNAQRNTADIRFIVSYDTISKNEKEAHFEVNSIVNETAISMKTFELSTYTQDFLFLVTDDLTVFWDEFLHSDQL